MTAFDEGGLRPEERKLLDDPETDPMMLSVLGKLGRTRLACDRVEAKTRVECMADVDHAQLAESYLEVCEALAITLAHRERQIASVRRLEQAVHELSNRELAREMDRLRQERDDANQRANDAFALGRRSAVPA